MLIALRPAVVRYAVIRAPGNVTGERIMNRYLIALAGVLALTAAPLATALPIVSIAPADTTLSVGDTTRVDVRVDGLDAEYVGAYEFQIDWGAALLGLSGVPTFDVFLDGPADSLQLASGGPGSVSILEVSFGLLANQTGTGGFRLFSFDVVALAAGTASLAFDATAPLLLVDGLGIEYAEVQYVGSRLTITDRVVGVPEPGTASLFGLAFAALLVRSGRRAHLGR